MANKPLNRRYMDAVAQQGCHVCSALGYGYSPAELHHIRDGQGMSQRSSDYLVVPLCAQHHRLGGGGVAIHAGQRQFENLYGTELDLLAMTIAKGFGERHG